jgi:hypothetical protein
VVGAEIRAISARGSWGVAADTSRLWSGDDEVELFATDAPQEALWQRAEAMDEKHNGMVPTGLFIQSLNEMIDDQGKRLAALRYRVPHAVQLALWRCAIVGGFADCASGLERPAPAPRSISLESWSPL